MDVWSDVACPWCYIGKRRFEAGRDAFEQLGDGRRVDLEYHSFELSPDTDSTSTRARVTLAASADRSSRVTGPNVTQALPWSP